MQRMTTRIIWLVAGVCAASIALSPVAIIAANRAPSQPAVVATVNLEEVFNSIKLKEQEDANLQKYADDLQKAQDKIRDEIQRMEEELGGLAPGTTAYQDKFRAMQQKILEYGAAVDHNRLRLDRKKGSTLRNIYLEIKKEVAAMSRELGIDIVMLDDSIVELDSGREEDVSRQISARRTLYSNPALDITQELIDRMNR